MNISLIKESSFGQEAPMPLQAPRIAPGVAEKANELAPAIERKVQGILEKSGAMWECIGAKIGPFGGKIMIHRCKSEYNNRTPQSKIEQQKATRAYQSKTAEILPAIEPDPMSLVFFDPNPTAEVLKRWEENLLQRTLMAARRIFANHSYPTELINGLISTMEDDTRRQIQLILEDRQKVGADLQWLGFRIENLKNTVIFETPDRDELLRGWKVLQESQLKTITLPPLTIAPSKDIATDVEYVHAYVNHNVLMSEGFEYMHDIWAHVIPQLGRMLEGEETYRYSQNSILECIRSVTNRLKIANEQSGRVYQEQLDFVLSLAVDVIFNVDRIELKKMPLALFFEKTIKTVWEEPQFKGYIEKRFGERALTCAQMESLLNT